MLNIKYFSPSDFKVIYIEDGEWILMDNEGNKSPTSKYYPNSQHWNGDSPFFPVDYEAELDTLFDNEQAIHWMLFYNLRRFADGITFKKDDYLKEVAIDCQKQALNNIKKITEAYLEFTYAQDI